MRNAILMLLFAGLAQGGETLGSFSGLCTGGARPPVTLDQPQYTGFCRVEATREELRITMHVRGPVIEHASVLTGVDVMYRDDAGRLENGGGFPPVLHVRTEDVCSFTIVPQDLNVSRDIVRYVAELGNPVIRSARMRVIVQPAEDDTPDSHRIVVTFRMEGEPIWRY